MKPYAWKINTQTTALLKKHDLFKVPVNVEELAQHLGADVVYDELDDDVSGLLLLDGDTHTIAINKHHHPNRQRFTLAHECGHLYLHAGQGDRLWVDKTLFFRNENSSAGDYFAEIQANHFAAGLLMPEALIREHLDDGNPISDRDIARLAARFAVSERAMTVRLVSLELMESVAA